MNVIAVDLDGTLFNIQTKVPMWEAIEKVNKAFEDKNNFVVIYTARSYEIFHDTRDLLMQHRIKHHALVMEKMRATKYWDDRCEELPV